MKVGLIVPTLNAGELWESWLLALQAQSYQPDFILVIDSASNDKTVSLAKASGYQVECIKQQDFDHGGTRQLGVELLSEADILIFLTQDAVLASNNALEDLLNVFTDPSVGSVYGRQLPASNATLLSAFHRQHNYPKQSYSATQKSLQSLGIRAVYCSNSFAAYRRSALLGVGGFPEKLIMGEDMLIAARLLAAGYKHCYCAEACVYHSHNFTFGQEFKRFFDMGVFHQTTPEIGRLTEQTRSSGMDYVKAELRYARSISGGLVLYSLSKNAIRWLAYKLGRLHAFVPTSFRHRLSANVSYWKNTPKQAGRE
jgi:rhamnosyltransferase